MITSKQTLKIYYIENKNICDKYF